MTRTPIRNRNSFAVRPAAALESAMVSSLLQSRWKPFLAGAGCGLQTRCAVLCVAGGFDSHWLPPRHLTSNARKKPGNLGGVRRTGMWVTPCGQGIQKSGSTAAPETRSTFLDACVAQPSRNFSRHDPERGPHARLAHMTLDRAVLEAATSISSTRSAPKWPKSGGIPAPKKRAGTSATTITVRHLGVGQSTGMMIKAGGIT
jgi:hypothetical protein